MLGHRISGSKAAYYKSKTHVLKEDYALFVKELSIKDVIIKDRTPAQIKEIVKENIEIRETQADIADQFQKILEFAKTDPEGFIEYMKKEEN